MSLLPFIAGHPFCRWGDWYETPNFGRSSDEDFGTGLLRDDPFFSRVVAPAMAPHSKRFRGRSALKKTGCGSFEVLENADNFAVHMDVSHFAPDEVKVKVVDANLVVEGSHEEKVDGRGLVSRSFTRRCALPEDVDPAKLSSSLSQNGVLRIEAPKENSKKPEEMTIPIELVGGEATKTRKAVQESKK